jgi:hypothetical protein
LDPRYQAKESQHLGLHLKGDVEVLHDIVHTEGNTGPCPQHHHRGLQSDGIVPSIVDNDLRYELQLHQLSERLNDVDART